MASRDFTLVIGLSNGTLVSPLFLSFYRILASCIMFVLINYQTKLQINKTYKHTKPKFRQNLTILRLKEKFKGTDISNLTPISLFTLELRTHTLSFKYNF